MTKLIDATKLRRTISDVRFDPHEHPSVLVCEIIDAMPPLSCTTCKLPSWYENSVYGYCTYVSHIDPDFACNRWTRYAPASRPSAMICGPWNRLMSSWTSCNCGS